MSWPRRLILAVTGLTIGYVGGRIIRARMTRLQTPGIRMSTAELTDTELQDFLARWQQWEEKNAEDG